MAVKKVYIGSVGPSLYDDTDAVADADGDFSGALRKGITTHSMMVEEAPSLDDDVVRLLDVAATIAASHTQGTDTTLGTQIEALDMGDYNINNLANAVDIHDATTLEDLLNSVNLTLNWWIQATSTLGTAYSATPASATELITGTPQELTTADTFFKTTVANTPTPFTIKNGTVLLTHFEAKAESTTGTKPVSLHAELWIASSAGTAESQIGADSTSTGTLTEDKTLYELHLHVATETEIAATKRIFLRIFATTTGATNDPTVRIYNGDIHDHVAIPVAGSVLGNFLPLSGGTMSGDIAMGGSQQVTGLQAPDTAGDAIRTTAKITEALLESATDLKHAVVTLNASATTGGLSLSTQEISNRAASNAQTGYATAAHITAIEANTAKVTNATHTGEVTGSGALTVTNDAVTYAKMQNVSATDKVLGRVTAGAGDVEEIACTAAGRAILDDADAAAQRTTLGLAISTDVLAYDAGIQDLAGVAMVADRFYYTSADNVHVAAPVTVFARSILDDADEATFKATVNLEIGTDVQAYDATILVDADIGVSVQAYDATILVDADIGSSVLAQQTIGIADNNLVEIDHAAVADNDYAKFTANGLEGRSYAEARDDLVVAHFAVAAILGTL